MQWLYSYSTDSAVAKSSHSSSEDTMHMFIYENQMKLQNFSQKLQPQFTWPKVGSALYLFSPKLMTDNQSTFILSQSHCFFRNLLLSQSMVSDSRKVDVILYVLLLGRFTQSLCRFFSQFISEKQNSKMHSLKVLWKLNGTSHMV